MKRVLILGSTGSIGTQALDVISRSRGAFEVVGLSAGRSHEQLIAQARLHGVAKIAVSDPDAAALAAEQWTGGEVLRGPEGLISLVAESGADLVLNAIVGSAGLGPTIVALTEGIDVALANKESLVVGGEGRCQPCRPHQGVQHHVGLDVACDRHRRLGSDQQLHALDGTELRLEVAGGIFLGDGDDRRQELADLTGQQVLVRAGGREGRHAEPVRVPAHDIERLGSDRPGRTEDGDGPHGPKGTPSPRKTLGALRRR